MEIHKYVPFLQHIDENGSSKIEGTRLNPKFLYTGHGERNDSVIFRTLRVKFGKFPRSIRSS